MAYTPTDETIWTAIRSKTTRRQVRVFLWKTLHQGFHCGGWWNHIPGYEQRAQCSTCGEEDSVEHILTNCGIPGQMLIWECVRWLMNKKPTTQIPITYGTLLSINLLQLRDEHGQYLQGTTRLFHILVTESMYLIWKLRCERVIEHDNDPAHWHSPTEITNKWLHAINRRLAVDVSLTDKRLPNHHRLSPALMLATWSGTLAQEHLLPDNWIHTPGVLVGRPELERDPDGELHIADPNGPRDEG